ncbi:hypothetical protein MJO28_013842 [Puccinia striiformis f. sp. tritici]|uniref:Uncharacterized protein n=1 Tax=Puccinia striiformis f. sp. tritici TaxID=168172 RepID=A0ACC0DWQ4_9BASI|nr:hypothetical protein MJO28_013842 [Puccinia striiformis f. sp. tritici]
MHSIITVIVLLSACGVTISEFDLSKQFPCTYTKRHGMCGWPTPDGTWMFSNSSPTRKEEPLYFDKCKSPASPFCGDDTMYNKVQDMMKTAQGIARDEWFKEHCITSRKQEQFSSYSKLGFLSGLYE